MNRTRLDLKYWIKIILKKPSKIKEYIYRIKCWGIKERRRDNNGFRNSKYNIPFRRTQHGMVYDGADVFEERNGKWYIAKEQI